MHRLVRSFVILCIAPCILTSCSTKQIFLDPAIEQKYAAQSEELYSYLVADLAFQNQDLNLARSSLSDYLEQASYVSDLLVSRYLELLLSEKDYATAERVLWNRLNNQPTASDYVYMVELLFGLKKNNQGRIVLDQGLESFDDIRLTLLDLFYNRQNSRSRSLEDPQILHFLARQAELVSDTQGARLFYQQALKSEPVKLSLAEDYLDFLLATQQIDAVNKFVNSTKHIDGRVNLIKNRYQQGKVDPVFWLNLQSKVKPLISFAALIKDFRYGQVRDLLKERNLEEAKLQLHLYLVSYPNHSGARLLLANLYNSTGQYKLARLEFEKQKPEQDQYLQARLAASVIYRKEKDYDQAEEILTELLDQDKYQNNLLVWQMYAEFLKEQRKYSKLASVLDDLLDDYPQNQALIFELAVAKHELGSESEAIGLLKSLLKLNPQHTNALNFLAYSYAEEKINLEEALNYIEQALSRDPNNPYYLDTKAWIYYRFANYEEALKVQRRALYYLPDDPVLLEHYGDILLATGDKEQAQQYFQDSARWAEDGEDTAEIKKLKERLADKLKN